MSTLLVTLGTSAAIVPEAFLLPGVDFTAVHVLTTASEKIDVDFILGWFAERAPGVALSVTRVEGFTDFLSEREHFHFEEVLYRWYLEKSGSGVPFESRGPDVPPGPNQAGHMPHVCLSGGFKTMSAAVQKAAAVLGAAEVFHVLCDLPSEKQPRTAEEIETARSGGNLHWIRLGPESGWPQLRSLLPPAYPLETIRSEKGNRVHWVRSADHRFRERLHDLVERSHRIADSWENLSDLPFQSLATWSRADLEWLGLPLNPATDAAWVGALPKVELHCHLGGFATHGMSLHEVRAAATQAEAYSLPLDAPAPPDYWPFPATPIALDDYMKLGDANGRKLLRDPGCLRRQCELLHQHLRSRNVLYSEIRCSPNNYTSPGRSAWVVLNEIRQTFQECGEAVSDGGSCHVNLIIIATRREGGDRSDISRHLALAITAAQHWTSGCRVVGVDLAGFENKDTRAALFATDFEAVHRVGLAVTVHAGENDDSEGIWQAVFKLNTRRLGHALHLGQAPDLLRAVADRHIGIEMCPFANLQIKGFALDDQEPTLACPRYPLLDYLRAGIPVTVNTDNIGISAASLSDNYLLLPRLCPGITRMDLLRLLRNSLNQTFLSSPERSRLLTIFRIPSQP